MPQVMIPKQYERKRYLVAIPTRDYEDFLIYRKRAVGTFNKPPHIFKVRPLIQVQDALTTAHPNDPDLIADIISGLKRSSLYAKRAASAR